MLIQKNLHSIYFLEVVFKIWVYFYIFEKKDTKKFNFTQMIFHTVRIYRPATKNLLNPDFWGFNSETFLFDTPFASVTKLLQSYPSRDNHCKSRR